MSNPEKQLKPNLERTLYVECLQKQLDEFDLLSSIFCSPGEIHNYDPTVIIDFHDYIKGTSDLLRIHLDYAIFIQTSENEKVEIRIELPHLYPLVENASVSFRSVLLPKHRESLVKHEIEKYISSMDKSEGYIFQVINWLQDRLEDFLQPNQDNFETINNETAKSVELERLWIYSHHIKNKTKRQEIVRKSRELDLTGFSRPGKPGIICVEGIKENTQEFWKTIKAMHWQKITIKKIENKQKLIADIEKWRRFPHFKEELFTDVGDDEDVKMDMSLFMKFLDNHSCRYITKDLFGFE